MLDNLADKLISFFSSYFHVVTRHIHSIEAVAVAVLIVLALYFVYRKSARHGKTGVRDAITFLFPRKIYTHESSKIDYAYFFIDPLIKLLLLAPIIGPLMAAYGGAYLFTKMQGLLVVSLGGPGYELNLQQLHPVIFAFLFTFFVALLSELIYYVQHYLTHRIPFLWEFHKTHHSAAVLTPAVSSRVHPVDYYFVIIGPLILLPVPLALIDYFLTSELTTKDVFAANTVVLTLKSLLPYFQHSHLKISYGQFLSHFFMSPWHHTFHHSHKPEHIDKNFGDVFSVWDWVFGTLYIPEKDERASVGLKSNQHEAYSSVWKLYTLPFSNNIRAGNRVLTTVLLLAFIAAAALSISALVSKLVATLQ